MGEYNYNGDADRDSEYKRTIKADWLIAAVYIALVLFFFGVMALLSYLLS